MPKTTASKKKNRRNMSRDKNRRSRSQKAEKRKSRKNSPLLMNPRTPLRNEVELSPKRFLAESSTKGGSAQDLRPKFQPIYQLSNNILPLWLSQTIRRPLASALNTMEPSGEGSETFTVDWCFV